MEKLAVPAVEAAIVEANGHLREGRFLPAVNTLRNARLQNPDALILLPHSIRSLIFAGQHSEARTLLAEYRQRAQGNFTHLGECAQLCGQSQMLAEGTELYRQMAKNGSRDGLYNYAANLLALGELAEAEVQLETLLEENPLDGQAHLVLSGLRKVTENSHHVARLQALLAREKLSPMDRIQLHFALGKELEDLGEYSAAFENFTNGARLRRRGMQYRVESDVQVLDTIRQYHGALAVEETAPQEFGSEALFVFGLPRSGTTLVDRILSGHSDCESLGEITDLPMSLMVAAGRKMDKSALVQETASWPGEKIAAGYIARLQQYPGDAARKLDKTPLNFLYTGLIARAMPAAPIIWMERHPLDACFAMYKTLFQMGYPFSYSLEDLGHYYIAYWKLKQRWQETLGERVRFQRYETLVENFARESRDLVKYAGLDWQDTCGDFHKNRSAVATASSAQVRQPLYKSAVAHWKHYESELSPLMEQLQRAGIPVE